MIFRKLSVGCLGSGESPPRQTLNEGGRAMNESKVDAHVTNWGPASLRDTAVALLLQRVLQ